MTKAPIQSTSAAVCAGIFLTGWAAAPTIAAEDKNGVSPTTISRPTGPGSLEGLGDAFQPALNTGMARYSVTLELPEGVGGHTPELVLQYDSGQGFSSAGIGWSFGPGMIRRQADKGIPRYTDLANPPFGPDRYLGVEGEELVRLGDGFTEFFLTRTQGAFTRYQRSGASWIAHAADGTTLEFGTSDFARISDESGTKVYAWCLEKSTDTNGNVIRFNYVRPVVSDRQNYLDEIRYGPGSNPSHYYAARFFYEDRPDPQTDYRSGFRIRTSKRLARVDINLNDQLIRRYRMHYDADLYWSLLTRVTQYGSDGVSTLPATTFSYATFASDDPSAPICTNGHIIGSAGEPATVMDNSKVDLLDVNADGLPDLLVTDTGHFAYLNRGVRADDGEPPALQWQGPVEIQAADSSAIGHELSESNVHLADMDGDALADLVVTEKSTVVYFRNTGIVCPSEKNGSECNTWGSSTFMAVGQAPPPSPFGIGGEAVRTVDLDFDKRMDVIKSDFGAYSIWFNLGAGGYSQDSLVDGAFYNGQFVHFADVGVDLADMNGDRLSDITKITTGSVVYFANMGYGKFDQQIEMVLPDRFLDDTPGGNLARAKLIDINGDGLADLAVERAEADTLWFWLNLGNGTFATSRTITNLQTTETAAVRWADINGNGTTDLVYADSSLPAGRIWAVDLAKLIGGSSHFNALIGIDNGYGRKTSIDYCSSTNHYLQALAAKPWSITLPFPVSVVARVRTSTGLDLDGFPDEGPDGDVYITDYVYRDGYYDPVEKQFRGFGFVRQIQRGDERFGSDLAPTLVTRYRFHTGAPDGIDNDADGETDEFDRWNGREEEQLKGVELWRETTSLPDDPLRDGDFAANTSAFERVTTDWITRESANVQGGPLASLLDKDYHTMDPYNRTVQHAVPIKTRRIIMERLSDSAQHKTVEVRSNIDAVGNPTFEWNLGDTANTDDDAYTAYEYAHNEAAWLLGLPMRTIVRQGGPTGSWVSETRNYYDGPAFQGLPLGQIGTRGLLHRTEALISAGPVAPITERSILRGDPRDPDGRVDVLRQKFDEYGNAVIALDANARLDASGQPDGSGHERRMEYDAVLHKFPVRETIVLGNGQPDLEVRAAYDFRFGSPLSITDFNGHTSSFTYDTFGRLTGGALPGDRPDEPTHRYVYSLGKPISSITTIAHTKEGGSPDVVTTKYFDSLGRTLGTFEHGGPVMSGVSMFNPRGQPFRLFQPYFGSPPANPKAWNFPGPDVAFATTKYDAIARVVETESPPDANGATARATTIYRPLRIVQYDGEDNNPSGSHFATPKTLVSDGLGRLIEVHEVERMSQADSGAFITKYRYSLPDLLAEIEDANGNIKYMRYDGLGRRIFMNDCNRGHVTDEFDAVGNEIATVDAKGQRIEYSYDGANRLLTEDYLDQGTPLSLNRVPDVAYHYDHPHSEYPWLRDVRGQVAWVEDLTGAEFHGFDMRGNMETIVKRIAQLGGGYGDYTTTTYADSLGRVYQIIYPDGGVVRQHYGARGLLARIPHFVESMSYKASGQRVACTFGNGVTTTYDYDPRLRLTRLYTESTKEVLQDLNYTYDQGDNIVRIDDQRNLSPNDQRNQTVSYVYDNCYRLIQATGAGYRPDGLGTINYDYDRLGNMVSQISDIGDPDSNLGTMISGGSLGTAGRVGRSAGDAPGPHALTTVISGPRVRPYDYDDNGNMIVNEDDSYIWDFKDRLGRVDKKGRDIRYLYDYADRRVVKRVDGEQTTYISKLSEIREGEMINYVFAGGTRVAQVKESMPQLSTITQRVSLIPGWNLISLQVDPGTTDLRRTIQPIERNVLGVFGRDSGEYVHYIPGRTDNTLDRLAPNRGYWIRMSEAAQLLVEGPMTSEMVILPAATWTLSGVPGLVPHTITALGAQVSLVWSYVSDYLGWQWSDTVDPLPFATPTVLRPGAGYWLFSNESNVLAPPKAQTTRRHYYHSDHLGSSSFFTNDNGGVVTEILYYPFGVERLSASSSDIESEPSYRFSNKERDAETSLSYFEARYNSGVLGRFTSVDPVALMSARFLEDPQLGHVYSYARNSPVVLVDTDGMQARRASKLSQILGPLLNMLGLTQEWQQQTELPSPDEMVTTVDPPSHVDVEERPNAGMRSEPSGQQVTGRAPVTATRQRVTPGAPGVSQTPRQRFPGQFANRREMGRAARSIRWGKVAKRAAKIVPGATVVFIAPELAQAQSSGDVAEVLTDAAIGEIPFIGTIYDAALTVREITNPEHIPGDASRPSRERMEMELSRRPSDPLVRPAGGFSQ